jgi:hypothetical protein
MSGSSLASLIALERALQGHSNGGQSATGFRIISAQIIRHSQRAPFIVFQGNLLG